MGQAIHIQTTVRRLRQPQGRRCQRCVQTPRPGVRLAAKGIGEEAAKVDLIRVAGQALPGRNPFINFLRATDPGERVVHGRQPVPRLPAQGQPEWPEHVDIEQDPAKTRGCPGVRDQRRQRRQHRELRDFRQAGADPRDASHAAGARHRIDVRRGPGRRFPGGQRQRRSQFVRFGKPHDGGQDGQGDTGDESG